MILRNPQILWLLLLLPAFVLVWRWRGVRVLWPALLLRLAAVALLVVALTDPTLGSEPPPAGPLVVLVDQSDSLSAVGREALRAEADSLARATGPEARVLLFGGDVLAMVPSSAEVPAPLPDPTASNLADALRAARSLLPGGGRVLLLSDGLQTDGDALEEARAAAASGIIIDVRASAELDLPEAAIDTVSAPRTLRSGEEYPVEITASYRPDPQGGQSALAARLRLWDGEALLGDQEVFLQPGDNLFTFRHSAGAPGEIGRAHV